MKNDSAGFSLTEALFAVGISVFFLSSVVGLSYFSTATYKEENARNEMRFDVQKAMEQIKEDVRLTDGNNILYYPANTSDYTAISVPYATKNAGGFFNVGTAITWDKTVIYHVYTSGGVSELRRTMFNSYNTTNATRQTQLNNVVAAGGDAAATTTVLVKTDSIDFSITPTSPLFDGYNATPAVSASTSFGSLQLTSGTHRIRFIAAAKNASSSGYRMGFDQLSLSPSGGGQEAEVLPISADSGKVKLIEDMTPYVSAGLWMGNYQLEYQSGVVNDFVEFQTSYDQWIESNFSDMTHSNTEVAGTDPFVQVSTRENQSLAPAWKADSQTGANAADNGTTLKGQTVRDVISAGSILQGGDLVRFKFMASSSGELNLASAYVGVENPGTPNFVGGSATQLYFNNGTVDENDPDPVGDVGTSGPTGISIPAGSHAWSNWIPLTVVNPSASNYLVSFFVQGSSEGLDTYWDSGAGANSYTVNGNSPTADWAPASFTTDTGVHALAQMSTWGNTGTVTSQIYDTKMTSPVFGTLSWLTNGSGTYAFKIRSSSDSKMNGAALWSALPSYNSSPANPVIASQRYVQWQATMDAVSPYTTYPHIDNVILKWPGQTAVVDFSGYYTKRPNYGMFKVQVDGSALVNALQVNLKAVRVYRGKDYSAALSAEVKARNTGK